MADRTQLRIADNNDIANDDPFAELTRIMGFDPRQPVKPQAPAQPKAAADQQAQEVDFDIDLEKELMGDFDFAEGNAATVADVDEPAFDAAATDGMDDELAMAFDDMQLDDEHGADDAVAEAAPTVDAAFDTDFDDAVASSLDGVSPLDDDLPMADELAASLDQDFRLDDATDAAEPALAAEVAEPVAEPTVDHEFDDGFALSLEDELMLDGHVAEQQPEAAAAPVEPPVEAALNANHAVSEEDFGDRFDDATAFDDGLADIDFDLAADHSVATDAPVAAETDALDAHDVTAETADAHEMEDVFAEATDAEGEAADLAADEPLDDAFEQDFNDALAEATDEPAAESVAAPVHPAAPAMAEPVHAAAVERSLEDELNALLGAMSARPAPVAKEEVAVQQPVAATAKPHEEPTAGDLDWNLDEPAATQQHQAVSTADVDLDDLMLDELQDQDLGAHATVSEDDDFEAELAASIDLAEGIDRDEDLAADSAAPETFRDDPLDWLTTQSTPPEPARSWSRVTPVPQPQQASFTAQPMASAAPMAAPAAAIPTYRAAEPAAYAAPAAAQREQSAFDDEMPDVETVDVPERVVALQDDLDIPELHFEEDEPAAPGYDDLDAEFSNLLTEMNTVDVAAAPANASAPYADDSYNPGFKSGYDAFEQGYEALKPGYETLKPGYEGLKPGYQPEARTYAARPAEMSARATAPAGYADATNGFDVDDLPGSQPVSQADDFAVDELDYDPELDEAMSVPGLAEREAGGSPRRRGLLIAAIVGAVVVTGGLGAFALSPGGQGGSDAPVLVKADNAPIKVKPENPGGAVVPNQDNKVYDAVAKGAKPAEPVQQKLVTNVEEPVDVAAKDPARAVDLSPDQTAADMADGDGGDAPTAVAAPANNAAPAAKSEDRIAQVLQDVDKGANPDVVAVAPRKVRTMVVKSDGSLVPREDPAPAAPKVAAVEPVDPAPQHVAPSAQADADQTGTVAPDAAQADDEPALKPVAEPKAEAKAQSANTPAKVPVAPQRPSDQPVDVVGEVKPDQVASISPAAPSTGGGSWSMQIASQPTVESAQSTYQDLQRRYGGVLSGRTANIVKAEIAGKGTFYRVRVPAQSRNDAINLCTSYKAAGGNCFVSR
ncbi:MULTISPECIES: SPOR domain-containing protein [unclassified Mesorhizobium]|uniref:SPOR domain-containing protein n=1 Tax=unclassified Mesorhizobium TaxID=325217 RepID=UPI00112B00C0|nr:MULTISPECIES: SPOR domain-containing protein [unclassified Mesorhizobium]TPK52833.1 SPOR domain-containing protein [Mesorhizobium sp. B2-5-2]TPL17674.1 SPOR domain-containing protein [Mesorhizobium sp. B2-4-9]TPL21265.1 SPOR domain-containing protein [Mesorhizobium sp. B2-4-7]TPL42879.1 SPOR domain-containing protein [Mesorhizobium sp. B2-4-5]TPM76993.1 SPOR domain-containing protein [Mesorhizobium sp. B2-1-6]